MIDPTQSPEVFDLRSTFVVLEADGSAVPLVVDEGFWSRPEPGPDTDDGRLVSVIRSDGDWPNWEMHPHGDEVIRLLSGSMALILETPSGARTIAMSPGETVIVPAGTWHTANVAAAGDALYITLGRGTCQQLRDPT